MRDKRFDDWWETFAPDGDTFGVVPFDAALTAWNAALAFRATGEMPERPKPILIAGGTSTEPAVAHYLDAHVTEYFAKVEAQIAKLRAQVEQKDAEIAGSETCGMIELMMLNPNADSFVREKEAELATAEEYGIRKALVWISVLHRLPEFGEPVLVSSKYWSANPFVARLYQDGWEGEPILCRPDAVTHWMTLPTPPELLPSAESASKEPK